MTKRILVAFLLAWPHMSACAASPGPKGKHLLSGFAQGNEDAGAGNCATIAAVKAAMCRFGTDGWYLSKKEQANNVVVALRNQTQVVIGQHARKCAEAEAQLSGLDSRSDFAQQVYLAFAVAAEGSSRSDGAPPVSPFEDPDCAFTKKLMQGSHTFDPRRYLGIRDDEVDETNRSSWSWPFRFLGGARANLGNRVACVAGSGNHAWFVSRRMADKDGAHNKMFKASGWFGRAGGARLTHSYCYVEPSTPQLDCK